MASVGQELNNVSLEYWEEGASIIPKQTLVNTEDLCNTVYKDWYTNLKDNQIKTIPNHDFYIFKDLCYDNSKVSKRTKINSNTRHKQPCTNNCFNGSTGKCKSVSSYMYMSTELNSLLSLTS